MKKQTKLITSIFVLAVTVCAKMSIAQSATKAYFTVGGEVEKSLTLSIDDLLKLTSIEVIGKDKDGIEHLFKGVPLVEILKSAGTPFGTALRGKNLTKYILIQAQDGYKVLFSLPEIDPEFSNEVILLAYQVDGKSLPEGEGPFRLVVPNDKKHARWIRQINSVKLMSSME